MADNKRIKTALVSVFHKDGLDELLSLLHNHGVKFLSTGGTKSFIDGLGYECEAVEDLTGYPSILGGRVKTLHPKVFGGILNRRDNAGDQEQIKQYEIPEIDLVIVDLYPFEETVASGASEADIIEKIDIGGISLIRAAAKNHESVAVIVDPTDYASVVAEIKAEGGVTAATRLALAKKVFAHTARYDGMITNYLTSLDENNQRTRFPQVLTRQWEKVQDMRYGENPHQAAAFYRESSVAPGLLAGYEQLQGKELSYNNIADSDAAWECVRSFEAPACVIIKHANPCGVAVGISSAEAYSKAFQTDSKSAFGGIIAFNREVTGECAELVSRQFAECIIAPSFSKEAVEIFAAKKNLRLLTVALGKAHNDFDFKRVGGGLLVQTPDNQICAEGALRCVTKRQPTSSQIADLMFAWNVARFVKSNTIVYARGGMTLGVGAGQMSRVDSARIAMLKAEEAGLSLEGSVAASDAFFPFRDGLDVVVDAGCTAVIQPGGSIRDDEVIAAADERGIAMVFTGERHFRH